MWAGRTQRRGTGVESRSSGGRRAVDRGQDETYDETYEGSIESASATKISSQYGNHAIDVHTRWCSVSQDSPNWNEVVCRAEAGDGGQVADLLAESFMMPIGSSSREL
ncbi:hypothetical protein B0H19DRAFT_1066056 [Mycena capillaripes]|nr:hypothetical protein B0H19DRAFT_1066056 [Mycena capillaripes]